MRIAYALHWNEFGASGVWSKVLTQVRYWRLAGVTPEIHIVCESPPPQNPEYNGVPIFHYLAGSYLAQTRAWRRLRLALTGRQVDAVYLRYDVPNPQMISIAGQFATFAELNTNDVKEFFDASVIKGLVNLAMRTALLSRMRGIVCVTHGLAKLVPRNAAPHAVVSNGIDLTRYPVLTATSNAAPNFLFVGSAEHTWQGLDKVLLLATNLPRSQFHIVGLTRQIGARENVTFHGRQDLHGIVRIAARCDVGLGTLALFRKGADEACPLKVREYLALGIPVIGGYNDTDIPSTSDYFLRIPNNEQGVDLALQDIIQFSERWRGRRVPRNQVDSISAEAKEAARIAFIQSNIR